MAVSVATNKIVEDGTDATSHEEVMAILNDPEMRHGPASVFAKFFEIYAKNNG